MLCMLLFFFIFYLFIFNEIKCDSYQLAGRYIPDATGAVYNVLKEMAQLHASKKNRYGDDDVELLREVSENLITKETLREKLAKHVEQVCSLAFSFLLKICSFIAIYKLKDTLT